MSARLITRAAVVATIAGLLTACSPDAAPTSTADDAAAPAAVRPWTPAWDLLPVVAADADRTWLLGSHRPLGREGGHQVVHPGPIGSVDEPHGSAATLDTGPPHARRRRPRARVPG